MPAMQRWWPSCVDWGIVARQVVEGRGDAAIESPRTGPPAGALVPSPARFRRRSRRESRILRMAVNEVENAMEPGPAALMKFAQATGFARARWWRAG